jgi:3D (Asp-Asp-Asp) domain-containing protein
MKNLARGGALVVVLAMIAGMIYAQVKTEAANTVANDSQTNITKESTTEVKNNTEATVANDKNLVKKTAKVEKVSGLMGFKATAYCLRGRTANGGGVRRGIVAADPRVLPLGTRVYVSAGAWSGNYTVTDTGGAIKGRILDIWVPSCGEAMKFGRRSIGVKVLGR